MVSWMTNASRCNTIQNKKLWKCLALPNHTYVEGTARLRLSHDQARAYMVQEIQLRKVCRLQWGTSYLFYLSKDLIISICISTSEVFLMSSTLNKFLELVSQGQKLPQRQVPNTCPEWSTVAWMNSIYQNK